MYEIAEQVARWLAAGEQVLVAQVVATKGFSSSEPAAALAWTSAGSVGGLLPVLDRELAAHSRAGLVDVPVSDVDAVAAGLSCGGVATVLVQDAAQYPEDTWSRLQRHEPVCLVSELAGAVPRTALYTPASVRDTAPRENGVDAGRLLARGTSAVALSPERDVAVVALWPVTDLLVVGEGAIAAALADAAALLGWSTTVSEDLDTVTTHAGALTASDAFVVLSHDRATDVPALAAVLSGRAGYVGALGSRHTQAARRAGLEEQGVAADALARIHGPAGLDIDAHTPAEIAVSIVAEIIASRSGGTGGPISGREGPVHTSGVNAPPPRH